MRGHISLSVVLQFIGVARRFGFDRMTALTTNCACLTLFIVIGLLVGGSVQIVDAQDLPDYSPIPEMNLISKVPPERVLLDAEPPPSLWTPIEDPWTWQILPQGLIYKSYLAGAKESRMSSQHINIPGDGWLWDATLGTRVGLLRYGNRDALMPEGFQVDAEGSAQARLDVPSDVDLRSVDFRGGIPLTYGIGPHRVKFAFYHLSSHLGDEFLLANPGYPRINFSRDAFVLGYARYLTTNLRLYAETGWAFHADVSEPWEFQFGVDFSPSEPTGIAGAPFFAVNGHLREELNFGGNLVVQAGWAWLSDENAKMIRVGVHYYNGHSSQYAFYQTHEQQIGLAVWYDF